MRAQVHRSQSDQSAFVWVKSSKLPITLSLSLSLSLYILDRDR